MPLGHDRPIDDSPCGDVHRRLDVGLCGKATRATSKYRLTLAVGFRDVAASRTRSAGISSVHGDDRDTHQLTLILDELSKLGKAPARHPGSLTTPKPCAVADAPQIFKGDPTTGAFGFGNEPFTDAMIHVAAKAGLPSPGLFNGPAGVLAGSAFESQRRFHGQQPTPLRVTTSDIFDLVVGESLPIAGRGDVDDAKIDAEELLGFDWGVFRQIGSAQQKELPVAVDQIGLPLESIESPALVFAHDDGNSLPTLKRQDAYSVDPLEREQAVIQGHGSMGSELRIVGFISDKTFCGLGNGPHRHLSGQAKLRSQLEVTQVVQRDPTKSARPEADLGCFAGSSIERRHRIQQQSLLEVIWQKLNLDGQLHCWIVGQLPSAVKEAAIPPPDESGGLLAGNW